MPAQSAPEVATAAPPQLPGPTQPVPQPAAEQPTPMPAPEHSAPVPAPEQAGLPAPPEQPGSAVRPRRGPRWGLVLGIASGVLAVGAVATLGLLALSMLGEDPPVVGDCMTDAASVEDMVVVGCDSADAYWLVTGQDGNWTRGAFEAAQPGEVCADFPSTLQALWFSDQADVTDDTDGTVVCLEPLNPSQQ